MGKRGRPSKKKNANTEKKIAEKVIGNYLSKKEESIKTPKMVFNHSSLDVFEKDTEKRFKDKKKIKPVYFDDILMETLTITAKVNSKKNIFHVRRKNLVYILNGKVNTR